MPIPITQYPNFESLLPPTALDAIIGNSGINLLWAKGHSCPCVGDTGTSNPECQVCFGRGVYWDPSTGPYKCLLTLISWLGRQVDMGDQLDSSYGMIFEGHPILTLSKTFSPLPWAQSNTWDIYIESQAAEKFQATLRVGQNETVPAWQVLGSVSVAVSGAVVVQDPTVNQPVKNVPYTVVGGTITLNPTLQYPTGYPVGTSYTVEYYSPPVFVVEEKFGGLSHRRPFGQGLAMPVRFKLALLDLWLRDRIGSSNNIIPNG